MSNTTIDLDTELSAVNSILGSIGQAPVTTLGKLTTTVSSTDEVANTYENPEIALIYNIFKSCCQDVQNDELILLGNTQIKNQRMLLLLL